MFVCSLVLVFSIVGVVFRSFFIVGCGDILFIWVIVSFFYLERSVFILEILFVSF